MAFPGNCVNIGTKFYVHIFLKGVVMVETTAQPQEEGYGLHNGHGRFGNPSGGDSNAIYYLGHVHHHLTASLDWKQLRPIGVEVSFSRFIVWK